MRIIRLLYFFTCLICLAVNSNAQDAFFSQFYANRLYLNPAWAGIGDEKRISLNYRNQYPGVGSTYKTYTISYDQNVDALHGGLGFSLSNDIQGSGAFNQLSFSGMYSYIFKAGRYLTLAGGLQASEVSRTINASGFVFGDQYDPITGQAGPPAAEQYANISKFYTDFSTGIAGFYKNSYGGVSLFHLFKPYQTDYGTPESRLPRKLTVFAGTYIPIYEKRLGKEVVQLNPNIIYIQQKNMSQLVYGMETLYKERYNGGIWIRQNLGLKFSAIIFSAGFAIENIRLRYSYDAQFSKPSVQIQQLGSHEISMIIAIGDNKKIKHKAIKCPKI
jgi:type IX secretion system PorP/SprF family membrane protein